MQYKGKTLILDNFRKILKSYSLDIQDVVRSAILDGVALGNYIDRYRNDPYKLDQIRLAIKEGLPEVYFSSTSGQSLYRIRKLIGKKDLSALETQMSKGVIPEEYLDYILSWVEDNIDFSDLNVLIIPKNLLSEFDYGLRNGLDMSIYNTGTKFSNGYIKQCCAIKLNGKEVTRFLPPNKEWDTRVMEQLVDFSRVKNQSIWENVISNISSNESIDRLVSLIELAKQGINIKVLQQGNAKGYVYSLEALSCIMLAYERGYSWEKIFGTIYDSNEMEKILRELEVNKGKKVGGRLRRGM